MVDEYNGIGLAQKMNRKTKNITRQYCNIFMHWLQISDRGQHSTTVSWTSWLFPVSVRQCEVKMYKMQYLLGLPSRAVGTVRPIVMESIDSLVSMCICDWNEYCLSNDYSCHVTTDQVDKWPMFVMCFIGVKQKRKKTLVQYPIQKICYSPLQIRKRDPQRCVVQDICVKTLFTHYCLEICVFFCCYEVDDHFLGCPIISSYQFYWPIFG